MSSYFFEWIKNIFACTRLYQSLGKADKDVLCNFATLAVQISKVMRTCRESRKFQANCRRVRAHETLLKGKLVIIEQSSRLGHRESAAFGALTRETMARCALPMSPKSWYMVIYYQETHCLSSLLGGTARVTARRSCSMRKSIRENSQLHRHGDSLV